MSRTKRRKWNPKHRAFTAEGPDRHNFWSLMFFGHPARANNEKAAKANFRRSPHKKRRQQERRIIEETP